MLNQEDTLTVLRLLAEGERAGTWNVYLHYPRFRDREGAMARAIRAVYAMVGTVPFDAVNTPEIRDEVTE